VANRTPYLGLILPINGEYTNTWDVPVNGNFSKIDTAIEGVTTEVQASRFQLASLPAFLSVSIEADGTLKPTAEVEESRNSKVYGQFDSAGNSYTLGDRIELGDIEVFYARSGALDLLSALSFIGRGNTVPDSVVSGAIDASGNPSFLGSASNKFKLEASTNSPIIFNISGKRMSLTQDLDVNSTGVSGLQILIAEAPDVPVLPTGWPTLVPSTIVVPVTAGGSAVADPDSGSRVRKFTSTIDLNLYNVRRGMILTINTTNSPNNGSYIIDQVGLTSGGITDNFSLTIIGVFDSSGTALDFTITDPTQPKFSVVASTATLTAGQCRVGEAMADAAASLSSVLAYAFNHRYESTFKGMVSAGSIVTVDYQHNLGFIPTSIQILVSSGVDGTPWVEPLTVAESTHNFASSVTSSLILSPGTWSQGTWIPAATPGVATPSYSPLPDYSPLPSLSGSVTGGPLTGSLKPLNSVRLRTTKTLLSIKNITAGFVFSDFDGQAHDTGYIKVIVS